MKSANVKKNNALVVTKCLACVQFYLYVHGYNLPQIQLNILGGGGGGDVKLLGIFCDLYKHVSGKSHLPVKEYE